MKYKQCFRLMKLKYEVKPGCLLFCGILKHGFLTLTLFSRASLLGERLYMLYVMIEILLRPREPEQRNY